MTINLPALVTTRAISEGQWNTLCNLFPGAKLESIALVWDYCKARQLDPMKKPCHIVPMRVKVGNDYQWRDVVMPGIYEYRTTATRTGLYLGHSKPEYGPISEHWGVPAPEWCELTVYRWNKEAGVRSEYPVRVYFSECATTRRNGDKEMLNDRWNRAPIQMLTKCTEAAGLREAFPDELGGEPTAEEMEGREPIESTATRIDPRGEAHIEADPNAVEIAVERMLAAVNLDADEDARAIAVMDAHDEVNKDQAAYIAAADVAASRMKGFKSAWKAYMKRGKELDSQPAFTGRAA